MRPNVLLVKGLCAWPKLIPCNSREAGQNHGEYHNSFSSKYLTLCALCALCGFEESGLIIAIVYYDQKLRI